MSNTEKNPLDSHLGERDLAFASRIDRMMLALERLAPAEPTIPSFDSADAFVWHAGDRRLDGIQNVNRIDIDLLKSIDRVKNTVIENTRRFATGLPANNALLWGARGMGKSSLVKAVHAHIVETVADCGLKLVEIHREDIETLPLLLTVLKKAPGWRFILYVDDLSFDEDDTSYKSLKGVLEGGLEGRPDNVIFYATSNRRHILSRNMIENEQQTAIHASEAVEEKVSLSDRFGLWLGFHACPQPEYFDMIDGYVAHYGLEIDQEELRARAIEWQVTRGSRSGRVAWQFIQDLAGELGVQLD